MNILTQIQKQNTLDKLKEISPQWASTLYTDRNLESYTPRIGLDLLKPSRCIAGEAHGFNGGYAPSLRTGLGCEYCTTCNRLGNEMSQLKIHAQYDNNYYVVNKGWLALRSFITPL